jgi:hypothetical protein
VARVWHGGHFPNLGFWNLFMALSGPMCGAGEGNRTLMTSLEGFGLRPADLLRPRSRHVHQLP